MKVAILGSTGYLGEQILEVLEERTLRLSFYPDIPKKKD